MNWITTATVHNSYDTVSRAFFPIAGITVALTETTIIVGEEDGAVQICVTVTDGEVASDFPDDAISGLTVSISSTDFPVPGFAATSKNNNCCIYTDACQPKCACLYVGH